MTFTAPLGLLALLGLPAVLWLHLFRTRLPERAIAGLFLFPQQALIAGAGRTRTRLLRTTSLWLELLGVLLLAMWLAGLSIGGWQSRHVVLVLDDSASMTAGGTLARARARAGAQLDELGGADFLTVLRTGARPALLLGPRARAVDGRSVLTQWRPLQTRHDFGQALDLARELAGQDGEVVFVTDAPMAAGNDDITLLAVGVSAPNCALLTAMRVSRSDGQGEEVRARIGAFGAQATATLVLSDGERELHRQAIGFHDGLADVAVSLPANVDVLRVQLAQDAMSIDDTAWLLPEPARSVGLCDQLPPERSRALAIDRLLAALPQVHAERDSRAAQLLLREQPGVVLPGQLEVVLPTSPDQRTPWKGPFVVDRAHPWLHDVQLQGVVWVAAPCDLPGRVLIAAGSRTLASEEPLDVGHRLWLALDAGAGNLVRSPDWPVLFSNLAAHGRFAVPGAETVQVPLGGEARYRRTQQERELQNGAPTAFELLTPDGTRLAAGPEPVVTFVLEQPGVHSLLASGERVRARFAARFVDASESDLRAAQTTERRGVRDSSSQRDLVVRDTGWERRLLALLLLVCVLADWWLLQRRPA